MPAFDVITGLVISFLCAIFLFFYRGHYKKGIKDFFGLIFTSILIGFVLYSGYASVYFGVYGNLPFNQNNIVSPSYIAVIGGMALIAFSLQDLLRKDRKLD